MSIQYTSALPLSHFRLLAVVPGCGDRDLRFRFVNAVPATAPEYTAISYTWGHEDSTEIIHINDVPFLIRPNLWACLHCLRRVWKYIWADAICIDQNNTTEKNQQVRAMSMIYSKAKIVSVWLGLVPLPEGLIVRGPVITLEVDEFDWAESLEDLASRPYWSRSWVAQEFLLAQDVHLYCSNTRVDYSSFQDMLISGTDLSLGGLDVDLLVAKPGLVRRWPALPLVVQRHIDRYPDLHQPLYDLLASRAHAQSTDPRDKVFSLLGLVVSDERAFLHRSFPNYDLSEEQVHIVTLGHLRLFSPDKPLRPIFRALGISTESAQTSRLIRILDRFDYLSEIDPAQQALQLVESYSSETSTEVDTDRLRPYTYSDDPELQNIVSWFNDPDRQRNVTSARGNPRWLVRGVIFVAIASVSYLFAYKKLGM